MSRALGSVGFAYTTSGHIEKAADEIRRKRDLDVLRNLELVVSGEKQNTSKTKVWKGKRIRAHNDAP
jgi:hypothetical protein